MIHLIQQKLNLKAMHKLFFIFALLLAVTSNAQIRKTTSGVRVTIDTSRISDIREKLVQLALQNPEFEIADRNVAIAHYQLNAAKGDWLGLIQPSLNLNSVTVNQTFINPGEQIFFPLYNVGIGLPLNFFSQKKNNVKVAREKIFIAEAEKNERYRRIRREVLTAYEDYNMYKSMLEIQTQVAQDQKLETMQAEKDFADDVINQEAYKRSTDAYYAAQMRTFELQRNFLVSKHILEQMIGVNIDDVIGKR